LVSFVVHLKYEPQKLVIKLSVFFS